MYEGLHRYHYLIEIALLDCNEQIALIDRSSETHPLLNRSYGPVRMQASVST